MKLQDKFIYVVGTISIIIAGLIIIAGVALFMTNRIESATSNHAEREAERIAEMGEAPELPGHKNYKDAEFVIENIEVDHLNNGIIEWRTTEGLNGEYQSGEIVFYVTGDNVSLNRRTSEFPRFVDYRNEMYEAIEGAVQND